MSYRRAECTLSFLYLPYACAYVCDLSWFLWLGYCASLSYFIIAFELNPSIITKEICCLGVYGFKCGSLLCCVGFVKNACYLQLILGTFCCIVTKNTLNNTKYYRLIKYNQVLYYVRVLQLYFLLVLTETASTNKDQYCHTYKPSIVPI